MKTFKLSQFIYDKKKNQLSACASDICNDSAFKIHSDKTGTTVEFRYVNEEMQSDEIVAFNFFPTNPNIKTKLILWND
jgi:hypothetical protein